MSSKDLKAGNRAPAFSLPSTEGRKISLKDFSGKKDVVLFFYPKDDTPGCTKEACSFRDEASRFSARGAVVLGVSLDGLESHEKFSKKYGLPFPLLSDEDAAVSKAYGTYKEKNMYGRKFWGIERTTFLIGTDGKIKDIFHKVKVDGHSDDVLEALSKAGKG